MLAGIQAFHIQKFSRISLGCNFFVFLHDTQFRFPDLIDHDQWLFIAEYFYTEISNHLLEKQKICLVVYGRLRRSAANDNEFKLFFLHPFLASKIYNKTFKTKSNIGSVGLFEIQAFEWTAYFQF